MTKRHELIIYEFEFDRLKSREKNFIFTGFDKQYMVGEEIRLIKLDVLSDKPKYRNQLLVKIISVTWGLKGMQMGYGILGTEIVQPMSINSWDKS